MSLVSWIVKLFDRGKVNIREVIEFKKKTGINLLVSRNGGVISVDKAKVLEAWAEFKKEKKP